MTGGDMSQGFRCGFVDLIVSSRGVDMGVHMVVAQMGHVLKWLQYGLPDSGSDLNTGQLPYDVGSLS